MVADVRPVELFGNLAAKITAIYGSLALILTLVIGLLLSALLGQKIRFENTFRSILLYPFALSFIVTGLVWQWILNPNGKHVTWSEPSELGIGMAFQPYALYPQMSVEGSLTFGLRNARMPKDEIARRVKRAAEVLQIEPLLKRKPAALSGGQRQRVAIGRALVRDVEVFLFDEPLSNLDAKLRADLSVENKRLHQQLGNTMIYVTHDQIEAMTLADRIAIMKGGQIMQLGSPDCKAIMGIRPEHIATEDRVAYMPFNTQIEIDLVEPMGSDTLVYAQLEGTPVRIRMDGQAKVRPGERLDIGIDPARASLFNHATELRL